MANTFLWYDLETFGRDPRWDRIAQFAAIRTDLDLEPVSDPIVLYGRISPDYLPDPEACLITGLTPRRTAREGLVEAELARQLYQHMSVPGTCSAGFNSIRFDDEFVRNLFYRSFLDPYRREYAEGNSRWDVLNLARMAHDLRPEGISWQYDQEGVPQFRLESLTAANGIDHTGAHEALADVEATIALARLIRQHQPRLFDYYLSLRSKDAVRRLVNLEEPRPLVLTSSLFTRPGGCTTVVWPLTVHPDRSNEVIVFDLREDPQPLWELPVDEIRRRTFTSRENLGDQTRIPLTGLAVNRIPAVSPLSALSSEAAQRLQIDIAQVTERAHALAAHPELATRIRRVYSAPDHRESYADPDLGIYSGGFFGDADRIVFESIHHSTPEELTERPPSFSDPRGPEMLRRYLGRNYPHVLTGDAQRQWQRFCARRLLAPEYEKAQDFGNYRRRIRALQDRPERTPREIAVLRDLLDYAQWLETNVLAAE